MITIVAPTAMIAKKLASVAVCMSVYELRKLFTDRQLAVPDNVVMRILRSVERSPAAVRDFVARADARALAEKRPVTAALVADLLAESGDRPS